MGYIDYSYYIGIYKGSSIPEAAFDKMANKAQAKVDYYTFNRIDETADYMNKVKMCCCELAEILYTAETQEQINGSKTSEKVGDYSVSYANPIETSKIRNEAISQLINEWLAMTGLLYRGIC